MDPKDFMLWHQLSCVNHKLGRHEDALVCVRSALKRRGEYKPAQQQLTVLLLAEAARTAGAVITTTNVTAATDTAVGDMSSEEEEEEEEVVVVVVVDEEEDDEDDGIVADEVMSKEERGCNASDERLKEGKFAATGGDAASDSASVPVDSKAGTFDYPSWVSYWWMNTFFNKRLTVKICFDCIAGSGCCVESRQN